MWKIAGYTVSPVLFIFFSFLQGHSQQLGFSLVDGKRRAEIPLEIHNNLVVVPVVMNGVLPLKFILDTGVRTAILTQKSFGDILNLAYTRKYTITAPGGEKMVDAYVTNNVSLDLPGVQGKGHAVLVLDQDYLELRNYLGTDVHGILGYEMFSRFVVKVDYDRKILTLYKPETYRKKRNYQTVRIVIEDTKPYAIIPVELPGGVTIEAKLLMDSGASHALLLDPASDSSISVPEHVVSSTIGRGLGGEIMGKAGRIKSVKLAGYTLQNVIANFPDPNSYTDTSFSKVFRNGTLGGEIMSRFTIVYNFPREEIYLHRNTSFKKKFNYNLSGMTIRASGVKLNIFEVMEVRGNSSSYRAGIKEGDVIYSIQGIRAETLTLNQVHALLDEEPGKKIKMELLRGKERYKAQLVLVDEL